MPVRNRLTDADIIALREKNLPRLKGSDIVKTTDGSELPPETIAELDAYFRQFVLLPVPAEKPGVICPGCERYLSRGNVIENALLGATFEWGLANGAGGCSECGYPARAYHRHVAGLIEFLNLLLPVHPDELHTTEERKKAEEEEAADFARECEERRQGESQDDTESVPMRERDEDDGRTYADPGDELAERRGL